MEDLLEGSRANLALEKLSTDRDDLEEHRHELQRRVMAGRYQEIRMLLFLGKDISRWLHQCVDFARRSVGAHTLTEQSFAALLVDDPPMNVTGKLEKWGVTDRRAVFSRAIGIYSIFDDPPPISSLSPTFINHYHRYADHAYVCYQHLRRFHSIKPGSFSFELYASEEYSRMLADAWERA